ncbi:MAG TPA: hypothetical protein VKD70_18530 [Candidatus Acidoferrum sp.]|nr:hypothetical protein [Candidatus Acidoferrum sp.]
MAKAEQVPEFRVIVVGGHTRSIGKTQLVCDLILALPEAQFVAGKITQYGHGVCAQNGEHCGCAPDEHSSVFDWESDPLSGTDSARFLAAGARRSFWLRTKQGYLAEGMPLLRNALRDLPVESNSSSLNLIIESNSLLQFMKPSVYLAVLDPEKEDFKATAQSVLDRADALVLRHNFQQAGTSWSQIFSKLLQVKRSFLQQEGEAVPEPLLELLRGALSHSPTVRI